MNLIQTILQYLHLETKEDFYLKYSDGTQSQEEIRMICEVDRKDTRREQ